MRDVSVSWDDVQREWREWGPSSIAPLLLQHKVILTSTEQLQQAVDVLFVEQEHAAAAAEAAAGPAAASRRSGSSTRLWSGVTRG